MKTNNAIYNINRTKIKKPSNNKKKEYTCIFHCPLNINDCINSIDIIDDKVVFGTLMGDVFLCRVDEKKLNGKNNDINTINKKSEITKSPATSLNKTDNIENDESNIKLNSNNPNNKYDCIKLSVDNKNQNCDDNNNDELDNDDNVKIFNKKKKSINANIPIRININNNNNENNNSNDINNNMKKNNNEKQENKTNEDNVDDEEENSNKYEKTLINKNMGKIQSLQKNGSNIKINKLKIDSKIFNEKQEQSKRSENKNINFPQITKLITRSKENIPCLEFENQDIINISIGDLEVIRLENMSTFKYK